MAESEYSQKNLASMLTRLGNVESMLRFTVAASGDVKSHVARAFEERDGAAEIYLMLGSGPKTQPELLELSKQSQANISKICTHLVRHGLVARDPLKSGRGFVWRWSDVEEIVSVSRIAERHIRRAAKGSNRSRDDEST